MGNCFGEDSAGNGIFDFAICGQRPRETVNIRNSTALRNHLQVPKLAIQSVAASGFLRRFDSEGTAVEPFQTHGGRRRQRLAELRVPSPVLEEEFVVGGKPRPRRRKEGASGSRSHVSTSMMTSFYQGVSGFFDAGFASSGARLWGASGLALEEEEEDAASLGPAAAAAAAATPVAAALPRGSFRRRLRRDDPRFSYQTGGATKRYRKKRGKYVILSLDGGGIRGITTLQLIKRMEARFPGFLASIDMFAGSSTGGITATYLATGGTPEEAINVYVRMAPDLFSVKAETRQAESADITWVLGGEGKREREREREREKERER